MLKTKVFLGLFLFLSATGLGADSTPDCSLLSRLRYPTPAGLEEHLFARNERLIAFQRWVTALTGKKLTAAQHHLGMASLVVDAYLYIGDIRALVNLHQGWVRKIEYAIVSHEFNKQKLATLGDAKTRLIALSGTEAIEPHEWMAQFSALRLELEDSLAPYGLLTRGQEAAISHLNRRQLLSFIKSKINSISKKNRSLEKYIGKHADNYLGLRGHLLGLISGDIANLLKEVEKIDGRDAELLERPVVSSLVDATISERENRVQQNSEKIAEHLSIVSEWIHKIGAEPTAEITELKTFLKDNGYLNEDIETAVLNYKSGDAEIKRLVAVLRLLRNRLGDARLFAEKALQLDRTLGLFQSDFALSPHALGTEVHRPTIATVKQILKDSKIAQKSLEWRDLKRELASLADTFVFWGWVGKKLPGLARGSNYLTLNYSQLPQQIILGVFNGMYNEYVANQYFPSLSLLQRVRTKDGAKLSDILEMLNAGSMDEMLVTFARRVDMKDTWNYIYADAESKKDRDPTQLFLRMQKAQKTAMTYGTMDPISERSRARYIMGAVADSAIVGFLGHLMGMSFTDFQEMDEEELEENEDRDENAEEAVDYGSNEEPEEEVLKGP